MGWISAEDYGSALPDPLAKAEARPSMDTPTTFSSPGGYDFAGRTRPEFLRGTAPPSRSGNAAVLAPYGDTS